MTNLRATAGLAPSSRSRTDRIRARLSEGSSPCPLPSRRLSMQQLGLNIYSWQPRKENARICRGQGQTSRDVAVPG
jgi:hypothetical protein